MRVVGSPLPSLGTWFHIFHLILSWNLSPRYFKLEGNEMLLILALADICPKSMHTTHTEIPHMHTTHMYTWWTSVSHPLRSCNRLNNHKSRTKIFTNVYAITKKEWNSTYCIQIQEKCLYLWKNAKNHKKHKKKTQKTLKKITKNIKTQKTFKKITKNIKTSQKSIKNHKKHQKTYIFTLFE